MIFYIIKCMPVEIYLSELISKSYFKGEDNSHADNSKKKKFV